MPHIPDRHTTHDLALVAASAAGDRAGADRELAATLIRDCAACATLADDLRAIARATATMPAARRRRDYTLTAEQAARLRPTGMRALLAAFGGRRFRFAMPVGGSFATLGLVALLVTALPGPLVGAAALAPGDGTTEQVRQVDTAAGAPAASGGQPFGPDLDLPAVAGGEVIVDPETLPSDAFAIAAAELTQARGADELVVILGGAALLIGIAMLLMRWTSRRLI